MISPGDLADRLERQAGEARAPPRSGSRDPCPCGFGADHPRVEGNHGSGSAVSGTVTVDASSTIEQQASIVPGSGNSSSPFTRRYPNLPGSTKNVWRLRPISSPAAPEHGFQRRVAVGAFGRPDQHDEMGLHARRVRLDGRREERAGDVDAGRRPRDLAEVDALDEQRGDDLHAGHYSGPTARPPIQTARTARVSGSSASTSARAPGAMRP